MPANENNFMPDPAAGTTTTRVPQNVPAAPRLPDQTGSTGKVNSQVISTGPRVLIAVSGLSEIDQTIMIFDAVAVPNDGASPKERIPAPANYPFSFESNRGIECRTGIVICNSTTPGTLTLGAVDTYWNVKHTPADH